MHVPPMLRVLRVAGPFFGKADAAGKPNPAIDDQYAAMRTAVSPIHSPRMRRMIIGELAAALFQHRAVRIVQPPTRAAAVEEYSNIDSITRALAKTVS